MKHTTRILALLLVAVMLVLSFAACGKSKNTEAATTADPGSVEGNDTPLVVGYSPFNEKFSPFFSETAYDQDVWVMTQLSLLTSDRQGNVIQQGINGTTVPYNGKDYTYYGPADLVIDEKEDGTVDYKFTLKQGLKFSDGTPITIDDVIFTMYVYADPTYDGSTCSTSGAERTPTSSSGPQPSRPLSGRSTTPRPSGSRPRSSITALPLVTRMKATFPPPRALGASKLPKTAR